MAEFKVHDIDSAPDKAKPLLESSKDDLSMIPNLHGVFAESPPALEAYQRLHGLFEQTSLSATERNVVWLTINVRHNCHYCVPAHTAIAKSQDVDEDIIAALRENRPLNDDKLEALRRFTLAVVEKRGEVTGDDLAAFYDAGYAQEQVLDIVLGVAQKVMSNYTNAIAETPLDDAFKTFEWSPQEKRQAAE